MKEYVYPLILLFFFMAFVLVSNFLTYVHEGAGHAIACSLTGGNVTGIKVSGTAGYVSCKWEAKPSPQQYFIFSMGGILAEGLIGLVLLSIPHSSAFGGFVLYKIGFSHLVSAYDPDLKGTPLEFLSNPLFKVWVFSVLFIISLVSLYIYFKFWGKVIGKK